MYNNDEYDLESDSSHEWYLEDTELFRTYAYQAEEISRTKFNIVICQLYNLKKHGIPDANSGAYNRKEKYVPKNKTRKNPKKNYL